MLVNFKADRNCLACAARVERAYHGSQGYTARGHVHNVPAGVKSYRFGQHTKVQPQPLNIDYSFESASPKTMSRSQALEVPAPHLDETATPPPLVANTSTEAVREQASRQKASAAGEEVASALHPHPQAIRQGLQQQDADSFRSADVRGVCRSLYGEPPSRLQLDQLFLKEQLKVRFAAVMAAEPSFATLSSTKPSQSLPV